MRMDPEHGDRLAEHTNHGQGLRPTASPRRDPTPRQLPKGPAAAIAGSVIPGRAGGRDRHEQGHDRWEHPGSIVPTHCQRSRRPRPKRSSPTDRGPSRPGRRSSNTTSPSSFVRRKDSSPPSRCRTSWLANPTSSSGIGNCMAGSTQGRSLAPTACLRPRNSDWGLPSGSIAKPVTTRFARPMITRKPSIPRATANISRIGWALTASPTVNPPNQAEHRRDDHRCVLARHRQSRQCGRCPEVPPIAGLKEAPEEEEEAGRGGGEGEFHRDQGPVRQEVGAEHEEPGGQGHRPRTVEPATPDDRQNPGDTPDPEGTEASEWK